MADESVGGGGGGGQDHLRIGDAERERTVEALRSHTVAGRLTLEEYAERVEQVYKARTGADLTGIMADLPRPRPEPRDGPFVGSTAPPPAPGPQGPGWYGAPRPWGPPQPPAAGYRRGGFPVALIWVMVMVMAVAMGRAGHFVWPVWFVVPMFLAFIGRRGAWRSRRGSGPYGSGRI